MKTIVYRCLLSISAIALLALAACGSSPDAAEPTQTATPKPVATFQVVEVTVPTEGTATPVPTPEGEPSTKGVPREFPENLKSPEGVTIGPLITGWQDYLNDSVIMFDNHTVDLCARGNGVAIGKILNGGIVWSIGPPREGMLGNEIFFLIWNPENDTGGAFVAGYENDSPYLKVVNNYRYGDPTTPYTYSGVVETFESFELTDCLNL
jgi:hypothetical protein